MATPTAIVAYLVLFAGAAVIFLFVNLLLGRFLRPRLPNQEKLEVYECGEPTIGSSFVQFDLRFYVVALLFIIFDVEVAFFFPWATVFGKANQMASPDMPAVVATDDGGATGPALSPEALERYRELGVENPQFTATAPADGAAAAAPSAADIEASVRATGRKLALASLADIGVFFAVLMVGFAYVWRRGDLDWVRAVRTNEGEVVQRPPLTLEVDPNPTRGGASILSA
jgi:NADH-quinone oxidoreductase subunit A